MRLKKQIKHGDTIVEVMLSIAIFSAVAMLTINLMNRGLNTAQTTLEAPCPSSCLPPSLSLPFAPRRV